jgi:hypothetical protein
VPDGEGRSLKAGDPVIFEYLAGDVTATVLAPRTAGRYLIQLDPVQPRSPHEHPRLKAALDDEAALRAKMAANPGDWQEPFEVDGSCLYLVPEDGEED